MLHEMVTGFRPAAAPDRIVEPDLLMAPIRLAGAVTVNPGSYSKALPVNEGWPTPGQWELTGHPHCGVRLRQSNHGTQAVHTLLISASRRVPFTRSLVPAMNARQTRCPNGHLYDATQHRAGGCPHCPIPGIDMPPTVRNREGVPGGFSRPGSSARADAYSPGPQGAGLDDNPTRRAGRQGIGGSGEPAPPAGNEGVTRRVWNVPPGGGEQPAQAPTERGDRDPVVGWLVAINGPHAGRDWPLFSEGNTIGRAKECRVMITGDDTIGGQKPHAILWYDPWSEDWNEAYYLESGAAHLSFVNGRRVVGHRFLAVYDEIRIGRTTLLFIPLCSERWSWQIKRPDESAPEAP